MILASLWCRNFRSFPELSWAPPQGLVVLAGPNGAGKTNLLEAVAVLGNLTSFRPGSPTGWVRHGEAGFTLKGHLQEGETSLVLEQHARLGRTLHRTLLRGGRQVRPAEYLSLFPVATLSASDTELIFSGPEHRRRLLDRLAFQLKPQVLDLLLRYRRALRQRNAALAQHQLASLDAFDRELARLGAQLVELRVATLQLLAQALEEELSHLGWLGGKPVLRYHAPEGPAAHAGGGEQFLLLQLRRFRGQELARGHTLVGPHRHDVCITISGRPAREVLSAGQAKLLATSLRLASVAVTARKRKVAPLVIFDDVDAELDREALGRLLLRLPALSPQVVVSTAHPEVVLPSCPEAAVVPMRGGTLAVDERSRW